MRHCFRIIYGENKNDWPRTAKGNIPVDSGKLPDYHPPINWLADKNHRVRNLAGKFYALASKTGCKATPLGASQIKANTSIAIRTNCERSYDEFWTAIIAVIEHLFNCHDHCGQWCKFQKKW